MGQLWSLHRDILKRIRIFLSPLLIYIISKCAKNGKHCSLMAVFTIEQSATQTNFGLTRVVKVIAVIFFHMCLVRNFSFEHSCFHPICPHRNIERWPKQAILWGFFFFISKNQGRGSYEARGNTLGWGNHQETSGHYRAEDVTWWFPTSIDVQVLMFYLFIIDLQCLLCRILSSWLWINKQINKYI